MLAGELSAARTAGPLTRGRAQRQSDILGAAEAFRRTFAGADVAEHFVQSFWRAPGCDSTRRYAKLFRIGFGRAHHRAFCSFKNCDIYEFGKSPHHASWDWSVGTNGFKDRVE